MEAAVTWTEAIDCEESHSETDHQDQALRHKLINLTRDWQAAALTLEVQRYKTQTPLERESLRDTAITYRKCISEVTEVLAAAPKVEVLPCS